MEKSLQKCLYCGKADGPFSSREHVVPEGLGNELLIIGTGIVCDRCNHVIGSELDSALISFGPIEFLRVYFVQQTKKGKYPSAAFPNIEFTRTGAQHLVLRLTNTDKSVITNPDGLGFSANFRSKQRTTPKNLKKVARALYKIGLGIMFLDHGGRIVEDESLDYVRRRVQGTEDFSGFLLVSKSLTPKGDSHVSYNLTKTEKGEPVTIFDFDFHGFEILYSFEQIKPGDEELDRLSDRFALLEF